MLRITNLTIRPLSIDYSGYLKPKATGMFNIPISSNLKNLERCGAIYIEEVAVETSPISETVLDNPVEPVVVDSTSEEDGTKSRRSKKN